jgi:hypothetical protein
MGSGAAGTLLSRLLCGSEDANGPSWADILQQCRSRGSATECSYASSDSADTALSYDADSRQAEDAGERLSGAAWDDAAMPREDDCKIVGSCGT